MSSSDRAAELERLRVMATRDLEAARAEINRLERENAFLKVGRALSEEKALLCDRVEKLEREVDLLKTAPFLPPQETERPVHAETVKTESNATFICSMSVIFVVLLCLLGWYSDVKIDRFKQTYSLGARSRVDDLSRDVITSNHPAILRANRVISGLAAPVTKSLPILSGTPDRKELLSVKMPGGFSAILPVGYRVQTSEPGYIEVADRDGVPSMFFTYNSLESRLGVLAELLETNEMAQCFLNTQKKIEKQKTGLMSVAGVQSEIMKWGSPYQLKMLDASALAVDFVRQDRMVMFGSNTVLRVFCTNIQIVKETNFYQIAVKRIEPPDTPVENKHPRCLEQFFDSISFSEEAPEKRVR